MAESHLECRAKTGLWHRLVTLGKTYPYSLAAGIFSLFFLFQFCLRKHSEWEEVFVAASRLLWFGPGLYTPGDTYVYPPFTAWIALPFTFLPGLGIRFFWYLLNMAAFAVLIWGGWHLSGGKRLEGRAGIPRSEHIIFILGLLCGLTYLLNCFSHQQTDVVMAGLMVIGCLSLSRGCSLWAATWFGLAAAIKCTPLLWLPYLAWRGHWRAAVWLGCVAIGVNLLPDLTCPSPSEQPWLMVYYESCLHTLTQTHHVPGAWWSDIIYNQSLSGASKRWLADAGSGIVSTLHLRRGVYFLELALLLSAAWIMGRPFRSNKEESKNPTQPPRAAIEFSMVFLLMLLLSPMSSPAHFGLLILPGFCLARAAITQKNRLLLGIVITAVVLANAFNKDVVGQELYTWKLMLGFLMWETLLLLAGCFLVLRRRPRASVSAQIHDSSSVSTNTKAA